jgi:hypothetical protein
MMGPAELRAGGDFVVPTRRLASSFRRSRCGPGARHHRPASGTTVGRSATCVLSDTVRRAGQDVCSSRIERQIQPRRAATGKPWRRSAVATVVWETSYRAPSHASELPAA